MTPVLVFVRDVEVPTTGGLPGRNGTSEVSVSRPFSQNSQFVIRYPDGSRYGVRPFLSPSPSVRVFPFDTTSIPDLRSVGGEKGSFSFILYTP